MNWGLFWPVLAIGLAAALVNLILDPRPRVAWAMALTRGAIAYLLARYLPEQFDSLAIVLLVMWEAAEGVADIVVYVAHRLVMRREGKSWQRQSQLLATTLETQSRKPSDS